MTNIIRELRKKSGISQSKLAKGVKVSRQSITEIETHRTTPRLELAYRIAKYFNKKIEEVFIFETEK